MEMGSNLLVNLKNEGLQKILQSFSRGHVFLYITFSFLQKKTALLRGGVGGGGEVTLLKHWYKHDKWKLCRGK